MYTFSPNLNATHYTLISGQRVTKVNWLPLVAIGTDNNENNDDDGGNGDNDDDDGHGDVHIKTYLNQYSVEQQCNSCIYPP